MSRSPSLGEGTGWESNSFGRRLRDSGAASRVALPERLCDLLADVVHGASSGGHRAEHELHAFALIAECPRDRQADAVVTGRDHAVA